MMGCEQMEEEVADRKRYRGKGDDHEEEAMPHDCREPHEQKQMMEAQ